MANEKETIEAIAARELLITRLINAPKELVWEVWTLPRHIEHWWGPNGFTNTINKMDVRMGGEWEFIMHGPDGVDYKGTSSKKCLYLKGLFYHMKQVLNLR